MIVNINDKGETIINEVVISQEAEEKAGYSLRDIEGTIDDLYMWIGEATQQYDPRGDLYMMKEDLRYLEGLRDEYIFSSLSTNDYIVKSDNEEEFNKLCEEILKLNKELENEKRKISKSVK